MRIKDKIQEIEIYLEEFIPILPESFEDYKLSLEKKAACERYIEKIIEAVVDLAFLVIKEKNLEKPEDDKTAFEILYKSSIISKELSEKLKEAKGMRNIITHQYGKIDDEIIFNTLTDEIEKDINEFLKTIKKLIK